MRRSHLRILVLLALIGWGFMFPSSSFAQSSGWSLNVGYQNPTYSTLGLNLMSVWSQWALEVGVGYNTSSQEQDGTRTRLCGELDGKYLFLAGSFRPFVQIGTAASNYIGIGQYLMYGTGFFVFGSGVYSYVSYNSGPPGWYLQGGLGFDL